MLLSLFAGLLWSPAAARGAFPVTAQVRHSAQVTPVSLKPGGRITLRDESAPNPASNHFWHQTGVLGILRSHNAATYKS